MKKLSLIELIITIIVLGLLVSLAMFNLTDVKSSAEKSKELANLDAMTKAAQMHFSKEGTYPTFTKPLIGNPGFLNLEKLYPEYLTKTPDLNRIYYVDVDGNVTVSKEKYPEFVKYDEVIDTLIFEQSDEFESYIISGSVDGTVATKSIFSPFEIMAASEQKIIKITEVKNKKYLTQQEIDGFNDFITEKLAEKYKNLVFEDIYDFYIQGVDKYGNITPYIGENFNPYENNRVDNKNITRLEISNTSSLNEDKIDVYLKNNVASYYLDKPAFAYTIKTDIFTNLFNEATEDIDEEKAKKILNSDMVKKLLNQSVVDVLEQTKKLKKEAGEVVDFLSTVNMLSNAVKDLDMTGKGISDAKGREISENVMNFLESKLDVLPKKYGTIEIAKTEISKELSDNSKLNIVKAYDKEYLKAKKNLEKYIRTPNYENLKAFIFMISSVALTWGDEAHLIGKFEEFNEINNITVTHEGGKFKILNGYDDMDFIDKMKDRFDNENSFNTKNLFKVENINNEFRLIFNTDVNLPEGYKIYVSNEKTKVSKKFIRGYNNEPLDLGFSAASKGIYTDEISEVVKFYLKSSQTLYYSIMNGSKDIELTDWNVIQVINAHDYHTALNGNIVFEDEKLYYSVTGRIHDTLTSTSAAVFFSIGETADTVDHVHLLKTGSDEYLRILIDDFDQALDYIKAPMKFNFKVVDGYNGSTNNVTPLTPWIESAFPEIKYISPANQVVFNINVTMDGYDSGKDIIKNVPLKYEIVTEDFYQNIEWKGDISSAPCSGIYTVQARLELESGQWTPWKEKTFIVLDERVDKLGYKDNYYSASLAYGSAYVLSNGSIRMFGDNTRNALGIGHINALPEGSYVDISLPNGEKAKNVFTGSYTTLIISQSGKLYGFGKNDSYALINSTVSNVFEPTLIFDPVSFGAKVIKAQTSGSYTMILLDNGDLYFRGANSNYIAGNNTTTFKEVTKLDFISNLEDFDTMGQFVVAINKNDEVFAWGRNYYNVFKNSGITYVYSPVKIMDNGWIVKAGDTLMLMIDRAGNVIARSDREVSINGVYKSLSSEINSLNIKAKYIESGASNAYIISEYGLLYTFGQNNYGQLGHGSYNTGGTQYTSPNIMTAKMQTSNKAEVLKSMGNYTDRQRSLASGLDFTNVNFISKEVYMAKVIAHTDEGYRYASGYNGTKNYLGLYKDSQLEEFMLYGGKRDTPSIINVFIPIGGLNQ